MGQRLQKIDEHMLFMTVLYKYTNFCTGHCIQMIKIGTGFGPFKSLALNLGFSIFFKQFIQCVFINCVVRAY